MYYLKGDVISKGKIIKGTFIGISQDKIVFVGKVKRDDQFPVREIKNGYICPGFIDVHIHGVDGFDFMDEDGESFGEIAERLPKYGVTSFLATSRTSSIEHILSFLDAAKSHYSVEGAKMLGVHLEGPWISPQYSGAQSEMLIRRFSERDLEEVISPYKSMIKRITLAPEELEDLDLIKDLANWGIAVSAGHTNATLRQISDAMEHGLKHITHTFNAMSPIHHREPGTAAAALYFDELICEIISDGVHVHPKMVELLYKVKGTEGMVLISDCTGYNLLKDGEYEMRGKQLIRSGNEVKLINGTLAGSAVTLDKALKYAVENCRIPIEKAVSMATQTPMNTVVGNFGVGEISEGYYADLVIVDSHLNIKETLIRGKSVYVE